MSNLAEYRISCWVAGTMSIELRVPYNVGDVFCSSENISVLRRTALRSYCIQLHSKHFSKLFSTYLNTSLLVQ
jgi:hypothetical protein